MNEENNNKNMMQSFALLMSEMMANEPAKNKQSKEIGINVNTVVIETPFTDEDDIEIEMTSEFWTLVVKTYLLDSDKMSFSTSFENREYIDALQLFMREPEIVETESISIKGISKRILRTENILMNCNDYERTRNSSNRINFNKGLCIG